MKVHLPMPFRLGLRKINCGVNKYSIVLMSLVPLVLAYLAEYLLQLQVCNLCYYQRYIYYGSLSVGMVSWFAVRRRFLLYWFVALLFLCNAGLAFYHMGVEYGWFGLPDSCSSNIDYNASIDEIILAIKGNSGSTCDEVQWKFILSIAGWNFLYTMVCLFYITIYLLAKHRNL